PTKSPCLSAEPATERKEATRGPHDEERRPEPLPEIRRYEGNVARHPAPPSPINPDDKEPAPQIARAGPIGSPGRTTLLAMPQPGGFVLTPDLVTLILSQPAQAQLLYIDTVDERITKRVDLDFQPTALALQGDTLFAAAKGSALIYALDAKTGAVKKRLNSGGEAIRQLACHPQRGRLYATSNDNSVYSINPATGDVVKTVARGDFLAVDQVSGGSVY